MRKLPSFLSIALCLAIMVSVGGLYLRYSYIPDKVEDSILWSISSLGFESLSIGEINNKGSCLVLTDISLDEQSFSSIEKITISFGLFDYFFKNKAISDIVIEGLNLTADLDLNNKLNVSGFSTEENFFEKLKSIQTKNILIKAARADVLTMQWGGITTNFEGQITISDTVQFIGNIQSVQNNLSFNAKVTGAFGDFDFNKLRSNR